MNDVTKDLLEALKLVLSAHGEQLDTAFSQAQDAIAARIQRQPFNVARQRW